MSATLRVSRRVAARVCVFATVALICAASTMWADDIPPYCAELKQVAVLVLAKDKFASIIGKPRPGIKNCASGLGGLLVLWNADLHL